MEFTKDELRMIHAGLTAVVESMMDMKPSTEAVKRQIDKYSKLAHRVYELYDEAAD